MTKTEIEVTIAATKTALSNRIGGRAIYSPELKKAILVAAKAMGPTHFSRESGLNPSLISQWNRPLWRGKDIAKNRHDSVDLSQIKKVRKGIKSSKFSNIGDANGQSIPPRVREITIADTPVTATSQHGTIRVGILEIEVPQSVLTPMWILEVIRGLDSERAVNHD